MLVSSNDLSILELLELEYLLEQPHANWEYKCIRDRHWREWRACTNSHSSARLTIYPVTLNRKGSSSWTRRLFIHIDLSSASPDNWTTNNSLLLQLLGGCCSSRRSSRDYSNAAKTRLRCSLYTSDAETLISKPSRLPCHHCTTRHVQAAGPPPEEFSNLAVMLVPNLCSWSINNSRCCLTSIWIQIFWNWIT